MATKYFYIGSHGPFFYDNSDALDDPDGNFPGGTLQDALTGDGSINIGGLTITGILSAAILKILDTGGDHTLRIKPNEDLSADRILNLIVGDADRTITLSGNPTLADWFDQAVKAASSPAFAGLTVAGDVVEKLLAAYNGIIVEEFNALVTSAAGVVTMSLEKANGGGDLTMVFSDGFTTLDCTPAAEIILTAGSDTSPTENYIYIPQSTKVLTKSTSDWPSAEHIRIGFFFVPLAAYVQNNGVYVNQNWNDDAADVESQGHNSHVGERLRLQSAIWKKGAATTVSTNGTIVDLAIDAGVVWQMHRHVTPSFDTTNGDLVLVVNQHTNNGGAYDAVSDLENLTNDANDVVFKKYFNWVIWAVVNKSGEYTPAMLNLPTGSYNKESDANADISGYDVLTMPAAFNTDSSTGFLIARVTMELSGGTWAVKSTVDLRGSTPQSVVGGGVSTAPTEFADNQFKVFDESDVTKLMDFQLSGISTGNTRTLTVPDASGTLTLNEDSDVSGNSWVVDEDNMASDLDTKVPTQQSVKAYVDAAGGVGFATAAVLGTL